MPPAKRHQGPASYTLVLGAHLDPSWEVWFEGMSIEPQADGTTRIAGEVPDQAALFGLIQRVRDLGIRLLAVEPPGS